MCGGWARVPSLVVAGEGNGQPVEEPGDPEGSMGLLECGLSLGAVLAEAAVAAVERAVASRRRAGRRLRDET